MPFVTMTALNVGDPTRKDTWGDLVKGNLDYLNSVVGSAATTATLVNGSFEQGTGATDPTGWVGVRAAGNTTAITTAAADVVHGIQGIKMVTPGSIAGGVTLTSDQFYNCANGLPFGLGWFFKSTSATSSASVQVKWYDSASSILSTSTIWSASTGLPAAWTFQAGTCYPPANAKQFKVVLTGVNNNTAASNYWDGIFTFQAKGLNAFVFTSSGTYTASSGVTKVKARLWAGGGGGGSGGDNSFSGSGGSAGSDSYFDVVGQNARGGNPGLGGITGGSTTGALGAAKAPIIGANYIQFGSLPSANSPAAHLGLQGLFGMPMFALLTSAAGGPSANSNGTAGQANTGQGGGGGAGDTNGGGGAPGAPGEYAEWYIAVTGGSYTITVGAGGAGGPKPGGAGNGGAGGSGMVIVEEIS